MAFVRTETTDILRSRKKIASRDLQFPFATRKLHRTLFQG